MKVSAWLVSSLIATFLLFLQTGLYRLGCEALYDNRYYQRFGGVRCLCLQGERRIRTEAKKQWERCKTSSAAYSYALKMGAAGSSKTSVNIYQTTRRHNTEYSKVCSHRCENLRSHTHKIPEDGRKLTLRRET
jgi:hypothetical protein